MRTKTLASTLTQWELLAGSLELHQAELPNLLVRRAALVDFITANRAAATVQLEAEGTLKDAVARREEITRARWKIPASVAVCVAANGEAEETGSLRVLALTGSAGF